MTLRAAEIIRLTSRLVCRDRRLAAAIRGGHAVSDPSALERDLVDAAGFDAAIDRAETYSVAGTDIRVVRRDDLIELKERAAADPRRRKSKALRDRSDVEMLRGDVPGPDEGW
jgi:hypothetical protein